MRATPAVPSVAQSRPSPALTVAAAWLVPGAGHALQGQWSKALIFCVALLAMHVIGLAAGGRLFPLHWGEPLVLLAAVSQWALGLPRLMAVAADLGRGEVIAASYEYGNTFLIVAGLLNALVVFDASDLAAGRKTA